jgi:ATPase involved in DNA repair
MLKQLSIQNYAIIDAIDIKFPGGMNVVQVRPALANPSLWVH